MKWLTNLEINQINNKKIDYVLFFGPAYVQANDSERNLTKEQLTNKFKTIE